MGDHRFIGLKDRTAFIKSGRLHPLSPESSIDKISFAADFRVDKSRLAGSQGINRKAFSLFGYIQNRKPGPPSGL
jgi:hypothetical protein